MSLEVKRHGFSEYTRLDRALELILSEIERVNAEKVPIEEACKRVLAEDIEAQKNVPPFDRAAMDGFAVRAEDTFGAEENDPNRLKVTGRIKTGTESEIEIGEGEAAEISTGAPLPKGADAVIKIEETRQDEDPFVKIISPVSPGKNVSPRGEDTTAGEKIFEEGRVLRPSDIGILASIDKLEVKVSRKPEVGISATGNELRKPGEKLKPGEITESNTYTLAPAIKGAGGKPTRLDIVRDDVDQLKEALNLSSDFDMLIFTGGTSVGEDDLLPDVISGEGDLILHGVAMRPGGPVGFGVVNQTPVFSLPGFPAATLVSFETLVRPALKKMQGASKETDRIEVKASLKRKVSSSLGRVDIVRAKIDKDGGKYQAAPIRVTGSSLLTSISRANGFIIVPGNKEGFSKGDEVTVRIMDDL